LNTLPDPLPGPAPALTLRAPQSTLTLLPLDGTAAAERALPLAVARATANGGCLVLAGIAARPADATLPPAPGVPPLPLYLHRLADTLAGRGLTVKVAIGGGGGAQAIADTARLWAADLIVMAAHDFGGPPGDAKRLVTMVMQRAAIPVLVVPAPGTPTAREDRLVELRGWRGAAARQGTDRALESEGGRA